MIETRELKQPGIAHGFFGRQGGHSTGIFASLNCGLGSGDDRATVVRNRSSGRQSPWAEREPQIVTTFQVHSAEAIDCQKAVAS